MIKICLFWLWSCKKCSGPVKIQSYKPCRLMDFFLKFEPCRYIIILPKSNKNHPYQIQIAKFTSKTCGIKGTLSSRSPGHGNRVLLIRLIQWLKKIPHTIRSHCHNFQSLCSSFRTLIPCRVGSRLGAFLVIKHLFFPLCIFCNCIEEKNVLIFQHCYFDIWYLLSIGAPASFQTYCCLQLSSIGLKPLLRYITPSTKPQDTSRMSQLSWHIFFPDIYVMPWQKPAI